MDKPINFLRTWSTQILDSSDPDIDLNDAVTGALIVQAVLKFAETLDPEPRAKLEKLLDEALRQSC